MLDECLSLQPCVRKNGVPLQKLAPVALLLTRDDACGVARSSRSEDVGNDTGDEEEDSFDAQQSGDAAGAGGKSKSGGEELEEDDELRGWSAGDFRSIRGDFDYTYVPEEDLYEAEEEEEIGGWHREERKPVQDAKVRETYVLKAWRLLRALPEKQRSTRTYAAMMAAFDCVGRGAEARGMLDLAASHGCIPDTRMYNAALRSCRDEDEVRAVLRAMEEACVPGDAVTERLLASLQ
jgi:hypothetical protein